jgi:hypothetical protein
MDDLIDAASDLSPKAVFDPLFPDKPAEEDRGLSDLAPPGILFRSASRRDLEDSFVSEREKEGKDSKAGPLLSALFGLEGWLPISTPERDRLYGCARE